MNYRVIALPHFKREVKRLVKKYQKNNQILHWNYGDNNDTYLSVDTHGRSNLTIHNIPPPQATRESSNN